MTPDLSLTPRLGLRLEVALKCRVCRRLLGDSLPLATVLIANMEAKVPLGVLIGGACPCCKQPLDPPGPKDRNFRRRARRYLKKAASL